MQIYFSITSSNQINQYYKKKFGEDLDSVFIRKKCKKNMKKKIKILKDKSDHGSYTFINEGNAFSPKPYDMFERNNDLYKKTDKERLEERHKKKKAASKGGTAKSSKGLKFSNPSQRNHSSIYE